MKFLSRLASRMAVRASARPHGVDAVPAAHLLALEPRMMFDGAAVVAAAALVDDAHQVHDASGAPVDAAAADVQARLLAGLAQVGSLGMAAPAAAQIAFVDAGLTDVQTLVAGLDPAVKVVLLDPARDGVAQIEQALVGRHDVAAIHLIAHGSAGELHLGSGVLDADSARTQYAEALGRIGDALGTQGDLLIYGCDFGAGVQGQVAIETLATLTGADVAASDDLTGHVSGGGDWALERSTGTIDVAALSAPEWRGELASATISATAAPTVTGGTGVGAKAVWTNAGTVGTTAIDVVATVTAADTGATIAFSTNGDDLKLTIDNGAVTVRWAVYASGTNQTVAASGDINFRINDIDGVSALSQAFPNVEMEAVAPSLSGLTSYTLSTPTNLVAGVNAGKLLVMGTQDESSGQTSRVGFDWQNVSTWDVVYTTTAAGRIFLHDGDGDLTFTSPLTTNMLAVDADADNSTATGSAYATTYTENGAAVPVVDSDVQITQHSALGTTLGRATVTLTNAQSGDLLSVGTLPGALTSSVDTSVSGVITVTLSGSGTLAEYQTALAAIGFSNTSDNPSTVDRALTVEVTNTTYGTTSSAVTSTIHVTAVNDAPTLDLDSGAAGTGSTVSYTENGTVALTSVATLALDDADSANLTSLTVTLTNAQTGDLLSVSSLPAGITSSGYNAGTGTLTLSGAATLASYRTALQNVLFSNSTDTPATVDRLTQVTASDGALSSNTATATLQVTAVNDVPTAGNLSITTAEDTAVDDQITMADADGDALTASLQTAPGHGSVTVHADGTFRYTPAADYAGADSFVVLVDDGHGGTATATVNVTVTAVNDAPTASAPAVTTAEDTAVSGQVTLGDVDGDALTASLQTAPGHGSVTVNADGSYTYTPAANYAGADSFVVLVDDGHGGTTTAAVNVTVTAVNDAPTASAPAVTTAEDTAVDGRIVVVDADGEVPALTLQAPPGHGTVTLDPQGNFRYQPDPDYSGTDTFEVLVDDGHGGTVVQTVDITVTPVNDPPGVNGGQPVQVATAEDVPVDGRIPVDDADPGAAPTVALRSGPDHGTVTVGTDGTYRYVPEPDYDGPDSFDITVSDGQGGTTTTTVHITVTPVNDPPQAEDKQVSTRGSEPVVLQPLVNASDRESDRLTVVEVRAEQGTVTLQPDGSITYTPRPGAAAYDIVHYTVSDGAGGFSTATVRIDLQPESVSVPTGPAVDMTPQAFDDAARLGRVPGLADVSGGADGVLLSSVDHLAGLGGGSGIEASGAVVGAVNQMQSLQGHRAIDGPQGAIAAVTRGPAWHVPGDGPLMSTDRLSVFEGREMQQRLGSSLQTAAGVGDRQALLTIDTEVHRETVQVFFNSQAEGRRSVVEYQFLASDGRPLPSFIETDPGGTLTVKRMPGVDALGVKVRALHRDGGFTDEFIRIDVTTGDVTRLDTAPRERAALNAIMRSMSDFERVVAAPVIERDELAAALMAWSPDDEDLTDVKNLQ
jgi:VCBS repeat-containing protein